MTSRSRTLQRLSYGLADPVELFEKLKIDAARLTRKPHPFDMFNFIVTAAVLAEWVQKYYLGQAPASCFRSPDANGGEWSVPPESEGWIRDKSCLPNPGAALRNIKHSLAICALVANATKHFHWKDKGQVESIDADPPIADPYQFFFTSREPDLYITIDGENYGLQQVKAILLQFYEGLLASLIAANPEGVA